jgi:hypothetical protein
VTLGLSEKTLPVVTSSESCPLRGRFRGEHRVRVWAHEIRARHRTVLHFRKDLTGRLLVTPRIMPSNDGCMTGKGSAKQLRLCSCIQTLSGLKTKRGHSMARRDDRGMAQGPWLFPHGCCRLSTDFADRFFLLAGDCPRSFWLASTCSTGCLDDDVLPSW